MKQQSAYKEWWSKRRFKYNTGLVIAGISAFVLYAILGIALIAPKNPEFEITLFTTFFQGIGYLFMMGIANLLYGLGPLADRLYNKKDDQEYRVRLFNLGFWFSCSLPFLIPLGVIIAYMVFY